MFTFGRHLSFVDQFSTGFGTPINQEITAPSKNVLKPFLFLLR